VTPIGINLPNDQSVRENYGSKSVSLANIVEAYDKSTPTSSRKEFSWDQAEVARAEQWQSLTGDLLTNMHEVIGHASGQMAQGKQGRIRPTRFASTTRRSKRRARTWWRCIS
jgi:dipeptidyl-peptidase-3